MRINTREEVGKYLKHISGDEKRRLAYLILTTKSEIQFRDSFAYYLQKKYHGRLFVGREFNRSDLAVLDKDFSCVKAVVEFKAAYSLDLFKKAGKSLVMVESLLALAQDITKRKRQHPSADIQGVFLIAEITRKNFSGIRAQYCSSPIFEKNLSGFVKYSSQFVDADDFKFAFERLAKQKLQPAGLQLRSVGKVDLSCDLFPGQKLPVRLLAYIVFAK